MSLAETFVYTLTLQVGRFHPFIGHEGPQGEQRQSSTLFQTSALEGGEGSASRPGSTLPLGKDPVPIVQEARWASGPVWTGAENFAPPGFDPRTVQPVGIRYTDYTTRPIAVRLKMLTNIGLYLSCIFKHTVQHCIVGPLIVEDDRNTQLCLNKNCSTKK